MTPDRDTFLTSVDVLVDTFVQQLAFPPLPGPAPWMSDSEVLTLLLVSQWRGSSERACLRWAQTDLQDHFPVLLSQSAYNRRVRPLGPICAQLMLHLAEELAAAKSAYWAMDTPAVPVARQCRGERHRLFADDVGIGRGGSDRK